MASRNPNVGRRFPNANPAPGSSFKPKPRTGSASGSFVGGGTNQKTAGRKEMTPRAPSTSLNASRQGAQFIGRAGAPWGNPHPASFPAVPRTLSSGDSNSTGYVGKGSNRISQNEPQSRVATQSQMNQWTGNPPNPLGKTSQLNNGFTSIAPRVRGDNRQQPRAYKGNTHRDLFEGGMREFQRRGL
jgi:hypothetical protein